MYISVQPTNKSSFKNKLKKNTYSSTSPMNQNTLSSFRTGAAKESTGSSPHPKAN